MTIKARKPPTTQIQFCDRCGDRKAWAHIDLCPDPYDPAPATPAGPWWCEPCLELAYPALHKLVREQLLPTSADWSLEYTEWCRFTMQLQLFALCAFFDLRHDGYTVRKRGRFRVEIRQMVGKRAIWQPLRSWPAHVHLDGVWTSEVPR